MTLSSWVVVKRDSVISGNFNVYTGCELSHEAGATIPSAAELGLEPPRFCAVCGRRMIVQIRPDGWWAQCSRHGIVDSTELGQR